MQKFSTGSFSLIALSCSPWMDHSLISLSYPPEITLVSPRKRTYLILSECAPWQVKTLLLGTWISKSFQLVSLAQDTKFLLFEEKSRLLIWVLCSSYVLNATFCLSSISSIFPSLSPIRITLPSSLRHTDVISSLNLLNYWAGSISVSSFSGVWSFQMSTLAPVAVAKS